MTKAWQAGPTTFTPEDMGVSTLARGFGRSVAELDPANHSPPVKPDQSRHARPQATS
jgi:hypothetical protein